MQKVRTKDAQKLLSTETLTSAATCIDGIISEMTLEDAPISKSVQRLLVNHKQNVFGEDIEFVCDMPDLNAKWDEFLQPFVQASERFVSEEMKKKQLEMINCIWLDSWRRMDEVSGLMSPLLTDSNHQLHAEWSMPSQCRVTR